VIADLGSKTRLPWEEKQESRYQQTYRETRHPSCRPLALKEVVKEVKEVK